MKTENLHQIIDHYLDRFEELNGPVHEEYYKWQIAKRFRPLMDNALNASDEEFPAKLYEVKKLTQNIIDSYTQPFNGLVEFSKCEGEASTVRDMFKDLFQTAEVTVKEKQEAIQRFLNKSHELRDLYFPDSYRFNDDLHSVTAYLFFYDPDHNYLYKASHCRAFADCVEFYDDWGYGENTKLDVFFRMCDEVLSLIKNNEPLLEANASRFEKDPGGMHPDTEKHILLFDLMYCCTSYGLFQGINYFTPKTGERKLILERKEKAQELKKNYDNAEKEYKALVEAIKWLNDQFKPGTMIMHKLYGKGIIQKATDNTIVVKFSGVGEKTLGTITCAANRLIQLSNEDSQLELLSRNYIFSKNDKIRTAFCRAEQNMVPYVEYLD